MNAVHHAILCADEVGEQSAKEIVLEEQISCTLDSMSLAEDAQTITSENSALIAASEASDMMNSRIHTLWFPLRVAPNEGMKRMYQERGFSSDTFGVALVDTGT